MLYLFDSVIRQAARDKRADIAAKLETCLPQFIHHVGTPKNESNLQLVNSVGNSRRCLSLLTNKDHRRLEELRDKSSE